MIFVTVGTPQQPFDRLVKALDEYASQTEENVIIQAGTATYIPQHAEYFRWTSSCEMEKYTHDARIVIAHAAAGAIILAIRYNKPLIVVPRLSKYQEHFNDHQLQLAIELQACGQAVLLEDLSMPVLMEAIAHAPQHAEIRNCREDLVHSLKEQLSEWQNELPAYQPDDFYKAA